MKRILTFGFIALAALLTSCQPQETPDEKVVLYKEINNPFSNYFNIDLIDCYGVSATGSVVAQLKITPVKDCTIKLHNNILMDNSYGNYMYSTLVGGLTEDELNDHRFPATINSSSIYLTVGEEKTLTLTYPGVYTATKASLFIGLNVISPAPKVGMITINRIPFLPSYKILEWR